MDLTIQKQGLNYFTFLDANETMQVIKEYYKKFNNVDAEVWELSSIAGCGTDKKTDKPIIKGVQAFAVRYKDGISKGGKTIIKEEWIEESSIEDIINKTFESMGYQAKRITFHTDIYLKPEEDAKNRTVVSEEEASDLEFDDLRSAPQGVSIIFNKLNIIKQAIQTLKKVKKENNK